MLCANCFEVFLAGVIFLLIVSIPILYLISQSTADRNSHTTTVDSRQQRKRGDPRTTGACEPNPVDVRVWDGNYGRGGASRLGGQEHGKLPAGQARLPEGVRQVDVKMPGDSHYTTIDRRRK